MKPCSASLSLVFALVILLFSLTLITAEAQTQAAGGPPSPEARISLANLFPPTYPPIARAARIAGDVKIQLRIRKDGSVESAEVVSGRPMLKQAALESAQKSTFECQGCTDVVTSFVLT